MRILIACSLVGLIGCGGDSSVPAAETSAALPAEAAPLRPDALSVERDLQALERDVPAPAVLEPTAETARPPVARDVERDAGPAVERGGRPDDAAESAAPLSGRWNLMTRVDDASQASYEGLRLGFHLELRQDGRRVTGHGQKWTENGRTLPDGARTPIDLEGTIEKGRLELRFTEYGARRDSAGRLSLRQTAGGEFRGAFTSDAARSAGTAIARRAR